MFLFCLVLSIVAMQFVQSTDFEEPVQPDTTQYDVEVMRDEQQKFAARMDMLAASLDALRRQTAKETRIRESRDGDITRVIAGLQKRLSAMDLTAAESAKDLLRREKETIDLRAESRDMASAHQNLECRISRLECDLDCGPIDIEQYLEPSWPDGSEVSSSEEEGADDQLATRKVPSLDEDAMDERLTALKLQLLQIRSSLLETPVCGDDTSSEPVRDHAVRHQDGRLARIDVSRSPGASPARRQRRPDSRPVLVEALQSPSSAPGKQQVQQCQHSPAMRHGSPTKPLPGGLAKACEQPSPLRPSLGCLPSGAFLSRPSSTKPWALRAEMSERPRASGDDSSICIAGFDLPEP